MTGEQTYEKNFFVYLSSALWYLLWPLAGTAILQRRMQNHQSRREKPVEEKQAQSMENKTAVQAGWLPYSSRKHSRVPTNDGTAADSLFAQLPFTVEIEDYSTRKDILSSL